LAIQLLSRFDFGHRTPKPGIFDHPTLKTVHFRPSGGFVTGFADVDGTWRWGPLVSHISPLLSLFSSPSPLSFFCLHHRQPPASEPPSVVQPPCAASPPVGTRRTLQRPPPLCRGCEGHASVAEMAAGWPVWANYDSDTPANDLLTSFRSNYLDV